MSRLVVIADANLERAERLREACAVRGYATRIVPNGALALETAVRDAPDVLVMAGPLDLIDAGKLIGARRGGARGA
ncbi:MAG: hypothetical protein NTZ61_13410 [Proteobacteria bacterium]|nr:hypothetical protein [Pseudomonadota bacterium]